MPTSPHLSTIPDLATQLSAWFSTLCATLNSSATSELASVNSTLAALSPLKRAKHSQTDLVTNFAADFCWQLLLNLLIRRSCEISIQQPTVSELAGVGSISELAALFENYNCYPFASVSSIKTLSLILKDEPKLLEVIQAIGKLRANQLTAAEVATLPPHLPNDGGRALRKRTGAYYTPPALAELIVAKTLGGLELETVRVVDPACGSGVFLLSALDYISSQTALRPVAAWLDHIYGLDINPLAHDLCLTSLLLRVRELEGQPLELTLFQRGAAQIQVGNAIVGNCRSDPTQPNLTPAAQDAQLAAWPIFNHPSDGLQLLKLNPFHWQTAFPQVFAPPTTIASVSFNDYKGGFDAVIGNPPYLGFNDYSGIEKAYFARVYPEIYNLKNDLLYYFIRRGVDLLKPAGRLGYVTSRFWKEAVFASRLREWLVTATTVQEIHDLEAANLFSGATIDVCLLFLSKQPPLAVHQLKFYVQTESTRSFELIAPAQMLAQSELGAAPWAWLHRPEAVNMLLQKIEAQSLKLGQVADCRTGVQTGYDRAFFVTAQMEKNLDELLELGLLGRALKNSDITVGVGEASAQISWNGLYLIYPPPALSPEECSDYYPLLATHLAPYRFQLEKRRRYDLPFPYCQLQWPRERQIFEFHPKLVTPYKAPHNIFALDTSGFYFSTDVISVVFKSGATPIGLDLEKFAANFLCSQLSNFQFRSYSKPVGGGQYDYYANPVKKLDLPALLFAGQPLSLTQSELIKKLAAPALKAAARDDLVYQLYNLSLSEIALVEKTLLRARS